MATAARVRRMAERLGKPQSLVVREAVAECDARTDRPSEAERLRMLDVPDRGEPVTRSRESVAAEIREIRRSRRDGAQPMTIHFDTSAPVGGVDRVDGPRDAFDRLRGLVEEGPR